MGPLARLLRPRSVAVIGGGAWGASVVRECRAIGFDGPVWPVHPHRGEVGGLAAVPSVADLPQAPDAAFVGVNRTAAVDVVAALAARGAGGAVCFAAGFGEAAAELPDGPALQDRLVAAAGSMPILGPNCYGFVNALDGAALWPDRHGCERVDRGVALICQSSNIAINLTMQARALPLAYVLTVGNQAQTDLATLATALLADPRVTALGLYVEGVGDLGRFQAMAAAARAQGTPIVALKSGLSGAAQAAAMSHSAALAGSAAGARALLARLGIAQVESLPALLETLKLFHVAGRLRSDRIAALSCSGGEAGLIADAAQIAGVTLPPLTDARREALRAVLGPTVALANPLDYNTRIWGDRAALGRCFAAAMAGDDLALGAVVLDVPRGRPAPDWDLVVDAVAEVRAACGRPMALISTLPETMPEPVARAAMDRGVAPLSGVPEAMAAIAAAARPVPAAPPAPLIPPGADGPARLIGEAAAKAAVAAHGLPVPRGATAANREEAARAAATLRPPLALKGMGHAHKTDAGAVALHLSGPAAVEAAAAALPPGPLLVEEMVTGGVAELLLGVVRDPAHGYLLTLGAGGTRAEVIADTAHLLLPATAEEIGAALDGLRCAALLRGWRGAPAADRAAAVAAVLALQAYVVAHAPALAEVEINPLICTPAGAVAADALIRMGDPP
ncbi:CoA-binding protein [Rhodobacteraceae bacterium CCMM004]|nr:CoA-binding protein [Rhodobacteraceae bacterium CCMM004]